MRFFNRLTYLFCTCLFLTQAAWGQNEIVLDKVIAVIGDEIATKAELEAKYTGFLTSGIPVTDNSRCEVLEDILFSKMLLNQAKVDSVEVSDSQVESELDRRMRFYIAQLGSEQAFEEYYKKPISQIKDELRESLREQLLIQSMQAEIGADASVTPEEVRDYFNKIPEDSLPLINAEVEVAQIVINAKVSDKSINAVKEKLRGYKKRISEGEKFSTLAVLYSEDKGSALKGGEIGFVGKAEVEPEFAAASFKLKQGAISPIIKTRYGYHIIQLIERRGSKVNVRHILLKPKQDPVSLEKAKQELDSIAVLIQEEKITFDNAAKLFSQDEDTRNNGGLIVNPSNSSSMTPMDELDPSLFFVIDKLEKGEMSQAVLIDDPRKPAGYRLLKLNKRTEPHKASLDKDYQKVKTAALAEKEQIILMEWMEEAVEKTYIRLDKEYVDGCRFTQKWIENMEQ